MHDTSPPRLTSLACVLMCSAMEDLFSLRLEWQLVCAGVKTEFISSGAGTCHDYRNGDNVTNSLSLVSICDDLFHAEDQVTRTASPL